MADFYEAILEFINFWRTTVPKKRKLKIYVSGNSELHRILEYIRNKNIYYTFKKPAYDVNYIIKFRMTDYDYRDFISYISQIRWVKLLKY